MERDNNDIYVDSIQGNENSMYLYNALVGYNEKQQSNPFSFSNDFAGRLSWNQSYRLHGMIELYNKTKDVELKKEIQETCSNLLSITNDKIGISGEEVCDKLWATKKYSLDKQTPRTDLADSSCILYSLLTAVNSDIIDNNDKEDIVALGKTAFEYFDTYYKMGHYYWRYGSEFIFDGLYMPWNQQNMFGLVMIEMYKATGEYQYADRAKELLEEFKKEWQYLDDKLVWNYWPNAFYKGWSKDEDISSNTPEYPPDSGIGYEDSSHSGINAKFILEYYKIFNDHLISEEDIRAIEKTLESMCGDNGYAQNMYANEGQDYSFTNTISNWWIEYNNEYMEWAATQLEGSIYPDFDNQKWYTYAYKYDNGKEIDLKIVRYQFNNNIWEKKEIIECASQEDILDYFRKRR